MTKTEEIMELVDACVDAAVRDYLSGNGEASHHCDKLKSAIEELVADAARYKFLRDNKHGYAACAWVDADEDGCFGWYAIDEVQIDAAMKFSTRS